MDDSLDPYYAAVDGAKSPEDLIAAGEKLFAAMKKAGSHPPMIANCKTAIADDLEHKFHDPSSAAAFRKKMAATEMEERAVVDPHAAARLKKADSWSELCNVTENAGSGHELIGAAAKLFAFMDNDPSRNPDVCANMRIIIAEKLDGFGEDRVAEIYRRDADRIRHIAAMESSVKGGATTAHQSKPGL